MPHNQPIQPPRRSNLPRNKQHPIQPNHRKRHKLPLQNRRRRIHMEQHTLHLRTHSNLDGRKPPNTNTSQRNKLRHIQNHHNHRNNTPRTASRLRNRPRNMGNMGKRHRTSSLWAIPTKTQTRQKHVPTSE